MADWAPRVIKVEAPGTGDGARTRTLPWNRPHPEKSGLFLYLNAQHNGVTLDISKPDGMALLEGLVAQADVLVHNVWPPDMDRVGLSFSACARSTRSW